MLKGLDTQITEAGVQSESKPGRQIIRQRYKTTRQAQRSINKGSVPTLSRKPAGEAAWEQQAALAQKGRDHSLNSFTRGRDTGGTH